MKVAAEFADESGPVTSMAEPRFARLSRSEEVVEFIGVVVKSMTEPPLQSPELESKVRWI